MSRAEKLQEVSLRDRWIAAFSRVMERLVPDALTTSIIFLVILFIFALVVEKSLTAVMDSYYRGLWMLLPFTMQMTLIIVLSSVLGSTPLFRKAIAAISRMPKTRFQVVLYAVLVSAFLSYLSWGLGIAMTPLVAIHFCKEAERRGIEVDFLFVLALTGAAGSVWQYGFSASAPLLMATPGHFLEATTGIMPLGTTLWAPATIFHEVAFTVAVIITGYALMPKKVRLVSEFPEACKLTEVVEAEHPNEPQVKTLSYSQRLERNSLILIPLSIALAAWLYYHFWVKGMSLDINSLNTIILLLCFLLHRNIHRFTKALQEAIVSCWPVVVMYHLYAGVAGIIQFTQVGEMMAGIVSSVSTTYTFPLIAVISGTLVAIFVPSSGGQWVIQGYITAQAAHAVGVTAQRGLLALSVGDHMGNLISPFWYVVRAGIARIDFRVFFGYGLIFALLWFVIGVFAFTFLPC